MLYQNLRISHLYNETKCFTTAYSYEMKTEDKYLSRISFSDVWPRQSYGNLLTVTEIIKTSCLQRQAKMPSFHLVHFGVCIFPDFSHLKLYRMLNAKRIRKRYKIEKWQLWCDSLPHSTIIPLI